MGTIRRYYADGSTYIDKATKDVWQRINGHWVRQGNVRDEGTGGIVGVAPRVNMGFNMAVALTRTQFLGSVLMDLGFSNGVDHVDRIRYLNATMGYGYAQSNILARVTYLVSHHRYGADQAALLSVVSGGLEEIAASMAFGIDMSVSLARTNYISAAMAFGYGQATAMARTQELSAAMAIGFDFAVSVMHQPVEYISASMDYGFNQTTALSRTQQATSAMAYGFAMAAALTQTAPAIQLIAQYVGKIGAARVNSQVVIPALQTDDCVVCFNCVSGTTAEIALGTDSVVSTVGTNLAFRNIGNTGNAAGVGSVVHGWISTWYARALANLTNQTITSTIATDSSLPDHSQLVVLVFRGVKWQGTGTTASGGSLGVRGNPASAGAYANQPAATSSAMAITSGAPGGIAEIFDQTVTCGFSFNGTSTVGLGTGETSFVSSAHSNTHGSDVRVEGRQIAATSTAVASNFNTSQGFWHAQGIVLRGAYALNVVSSSYRGGLIAESTAVNSLAANAITFANPALCVAVIVVGGSNSNNYNSPSFTDSDGNVWTAGPAYSGNTATSGNGTCRTWYFYRYFNTGKTNLGGTASWVTNAGQRSVYLLAIEGADSSNPFVTNGDAAQNTTGAGGNPTTPTRPSMTDTDYLDIAVMQAQTSNNHGSITSPGSGWTIVGNHYGQGSGANSQRDGTGALAWRRSTSLVTSAIVFGGTVVNSGYQAAVVAIKKAP